MRFLKQLKIELPYDPAIPLWGIYPDRTVILKDTCILIFRAALFAIGKTWKQPKCPSTEDWMKKLHTHTHTQTHTQDYYSAIKKNEIMPFAATWIDLRLSY